LDEHTGGRPKMNAGFGSEWDIIMHTFPHMKCPLFLSDIHENFNFLNIFSKSTQTPNFVNIHPVRADLFHADGRTYMTKLSQFCGRP
jgi:hypothetical protein